MDSHVANVVRIDESGCEEEVVVSLAPEVVDTRVDTAVTVVVGENLEILSSDRQVRRRMLLTDVRGVVASLSEVVAETLRYDIVYELELDSQTFDDSASLPLGSVCESHWVCCHIALANGEVGWASWQRLSWRTIFRTHYQTCGGFRRDVLYTSVYARSGFGLGSARSARRGIRNVARLVTSNVWRMPSSSSGRLTSSSISSIALRVSTKSSISDWRAPK